MCSRDLRSWTDLLLNGLPAAWLRRRLQRQGATLTTVRTKRESRGMLARERSTCAAVGIKSGRARETEWDDRRERTLMERDSRSKNPEEGENVPIRCVVGRPRDRVGEMRGRERDSQTERGWVDRGVGRTLLGERESNVEKEEVGPWTRDEDSARRERKSRIRREWRENHGGFWKSFILSVRSASQTLPNAGTVLLGHVAASSATNYELKRTNGEKESEKERKREGGSSDRVPWFPVPVDPLPSSASVRFVRPRDRGHSREEKPRGPPRRRFNGASSTGQEEQPCRPWGGSFFACFAMHCRWVSRRSDREKERASKRERQRKEETRENRSKEEGEEVAKWLLAGRDGRPATRWRTVCC